MFEAARKRASRQARVSQSAAPALKAGARDWPEKTEDWHVETGLGAQPLLSGMPRSLKCRVALPRGSGGRVMIRQTFTLIGRPRLRDAEGVQ